MFALSMPGKMIPVSVELGILYDLVDFVMTEKLTHLCFTLFISQTVKLSFNRYLNEK